ACGSDTHGVPAPRRNRTPTLVFTVVIRSTPRGDRDRRRRTSGGRAPLDALVPDRPSQASRPCEVATGSGRRPPPHRTRPGLCLRHGRGRTHLSGGGHRVRGDRGPSGRGGPGGVGGRRGGWGAGY